MSWLRRWLQRQSDLARGVDADLLRANRRRFMLAAALLCLALLLAWMGQKLPLSRAMHSVTEIAAGLLAVAGFILFWWAGAQERFLRKPDPEPPPSIFKD